MKKYYAPISFLVILITVSIFYNYHEIIFKRPQSVHKWRQSDCASIALNYYQHGMDFFNQQTHNLTSDEGTSGKCRTSEIPILYYTVAVLYKIFGYHDYIYRIFNVLLFFLGLFFLFKTIHYLLKDTFWAITLSLLFLTSPVLVYYGNNFLSNSSSLAFSIIGWYYFIRFYSELKPKWFYISIAVFFLAGALKITALFSLFAISGVYILELWGVKQYQENKKLFQKPLQFFIAIASVFIILGCWLIYAHNFNQKHDCSYFSTTTFPIWSLNGEDIQGVLDNIRNIWIYQYFHFSVLFFLAICFLFTIYNFKKANRLLIYSILFIIIELIVYILLQFWTFADHDYYVIDMYILPVILVICTFDILYREYPNLLNSIILKSLFLLFIFFNIYYAHQKMNDRYNGWMNDYDKNKDFYTISPYLRQLGISPNDKVISIPDQSHVSLYLMNQKGWTEYTDTRFNRGEKIYYNQDSTGIQRSITKGAKYLIINGIYNLYSKPYLQYFCTNLIGTYNNILIFDLKNKKKNFNINNRSVEKIYRCNAENLSTDMHYFLGESDTILFQNGNTRNKELAHSGSYSSKIEASSPYGMTFKIKNIKEGESFTIRLWRNSKSKMKGGIVVSSDSPNKFYLNEYKIVKKETSGWEQVEIEFFIPTELNNQELTIYAYNPDPIPTYIDDLEIIRYKSLY